MKLKENLKNNITKTRLVEQTDPQFCVSTSGRGLQHALEWGTVLCSARLLYFGCLEDQVPRPNTRVAKLAELLYRKC